MKRVQAVLAVVVLVMLLEVAVGLAVKELLPWLVGLFVLVAIYGVLIRR